METKSDVLSKLRNQLNSNLDNIPQCKINHILRQMEETASLT